MSSAPAVPAAWRELLAGAELTGAVRDIRTLPADAGARIYHRLLLDGPVRSVLLCRTVSEAESAQFVAVDELLGRHDVPVPRIFVTRPDLGLMLLSDLGERTLAQHTPADGYRQVYAVLRRLRDVRPGAVRLPVATADRLRAECRDLFTWFPPATGRRAAARLRPVVHAICDLVAGQPRCVQHGDLHARNIVVSATDRIGVVDFQDAWLASCYLDLATVIFDQNFRRDRRTVERMTVAAFGWLRALPGGAYVERAQFDTDLALAAAYWLLRLLGVCTRLANRRPGRHFAAEVANSARYLTLLCAGQALPRALREPLRGLG